MREFRMERVAKIAAQETPVVLSDTSLLILHMVPFSHFNLNPNFIF